MAPHSIRKPMQTQIRQHLIASTHHAIPREQACHPAPHSRLALRIEAWQRCVTHHRQRASVPQAVRRACAVSLLVLECSMIQQQEDDELCFPLSRTRRQREPLWL